MFRHGTLCPATLPPASRGPGVPAPARPDRARPARPRRPGHRVPGRCGARGESDAGPGGDAAPGSGRAAGARQWRPGRPNPAGGRPDGCRHVDRAVPTGRCAGRAGCSGRGSSRPRGASLTRGPAERGRSCVPSGGWGATARLRPPVPTARRRAPDTDRRLRRARASRSVGGHPAAGGPLRVVLRSVSGPGPAGDVSRARRHHSSSAPGNRRFGGASHAGQLVQRRGAIGPRVGQTPNHSTTGNPGVNRGWKGS
jgi:hypothetical protein